MKIRREKRKFKFYGRRKNFCRRMREGEGMQDSTETSPGPNSYHEQYKESKYHITRKAKKSQKSESIERKTSQEGKAKPPFLST